MLLKLLTFPLLFFYLISSNSSAQDKLKVTGWELKVKSLSGNKEKVFSGTSQELNKFWKKVDLGSLEDQELVSVEMSFNTTSVLLVDTVPPNRLRRFYRKHFNVLSDCETFNYTYPEWISPFNTNSGAVTVEILRTRIVPEGKYCLKIEGEDDNNDNFICALVKNFNNIYTENTSVMKCPSTNPDETWIFFYAYGQGVPNSVISVMVQENSPDGLKENYEDNAFYNYDIPLDFFGWRQFAIKYSDLQFVVPFFNRDKRQRFGKQGDRTKDPKQLMCIQFSLSSKRPGGKASAYIDNLMLLYNN